MKTWTTQNGDEIKYNKLEDSHLLNILKWIENKAEKGILIQSGGGFDAEDMWFEEDEIEGDEVFERYDYEGLKKEALKRGLAPKP